MCNNTRSLKCAADTRTLAMLNVHTLFTYPFFFSLRIVYHPLYTLKNKQGEDEKKKKKMETEKTHTHTFVTLYNNYRSNNNSN